MRFLEDLLQRGHIVVYDPKGGQLPDLICDQESGSVRVFLKEGRNYRIQLDGFQLRQYQILSEIRDKVDGHTDLQLLDGESIKLLMARYPYNAPYAMVRIAPSLSWMVGLPGLMRRLALGQIKLKGFVSLTAGKGSQRWLVLEFLKYKASDRTLSGDLGVQALLDYLQQEKVKYVVLRFYDKLPELDPLHDDLDLLVSDDDVEKVKWFLAEHPGNIGVDADTADDYIYPQHLADKILESAVDGPGGSRVPGPEEAFLSFAYHALYGKDFAAGVPSQLQGDTVIPNAYADYAPLLAKMAKRLNIQVPIDMESLDEYLHQKGWHPQLGSFAQQTHRFTWVQRRFFSHYRDNGMELGVLILKEQAIRLGLVDKIIALIERQQFAVLGVKTFDQAEKQLAANKLRGGNWRSASGETLNDYSPAVAIIVLDTRPSSVFQAKKGIDTSRLRPLKLELRERFDSGDTSLVHSTNDTLEAWEYIEVCFPGELEAIRNQINVYSFSFRISILARFRFLMQRTLAPRNIRQVFQRTLVRILIN